MVMSAGKSRLSRRLHYGGRKSPENLFESEQDFRELCSSGLIYFAPRLLGIGNARRMLLT